MPLLCLLFCNSPLPTGLHYRCVRTICQSSYVWLLAWCCEHHDALCFQVLHLFCLHWLRQVCLHSCHAVAIVQVLAFGRLDFCLGRWRNWVWHCCIPFSHPPPFSLGSSFRGSLPSFCCFDRFGLLCCCWGIRCPVHALDTSYGITICQGMRSSHRIAVDISVTIEIV